MNTKNYCYLLIALFLSIHAMAQPPQYRAAVNKAVSDANMRFMNQMMWNHRNYMYRSEVLTNNKYEYTVVLKDSSALTFRSRIHSDTVARVSYLSFEDRSKPKDLASRKRKVLPTETLYVSRLDHYTGTYLQGFPTDSCWLFRVHTGKVSIYSFLSELELTDDHITAIQWEDGPVEPFSAERLREMIKGDEKALRLLEKKNYLRAIQKFNRE